MDRFVLARSVVIRGRGFWGRTTSVRLEPVDKPGWYWRVNGIDMLIGPSMLVSRRNRIVLAHDGYEMNVFEHLGALRFTGLDSVRIISESSWLPYDGSAGIFWDGCAPLLRLSGAKLKPYTVTTTTSVARFARNERSVRLEPGPVKALHVRVFVDYPNIGKHRQTWTFPGSAFSEVCYAKTQGWPSWRRPFAQVASLGGWPHMHNVVWPQEHDPEVVIELFARHRALDILGALSVLCPPGGILVGKIHSHCGGHLDDIKLVQRAQVRPV